MLSVSVAQLLERGQQALSEAGMYQAMLCSQRELCDRVSAEVTGDVLERTMGRVEEGREEATRLHKQTAENLGLAFHAFKVRSRQLPLPPGARPCVTACCRRRGSGSLGTSSKRCRASWKAEWRR